MGIFIIRLFPLKIAIGIGNFFAVFVYYFIPIRKSYVIKSLSFSFPQKTKKEIKKITKNIYKNFARTVVEIVFFPIMSDKKIKSLLVVENEEFIEKSYANGKGAILMSAHFGNWELTALAYSKKYPMSVIVAEQSNKRIGNMINAIRTKQGFKTISRDGMPFKEILKALKRNEIVAILADQDAGRSGTFVPFFGKLASMPKGASLAAIRAGCPVIIALGVRQKNGVMKVKLTEIPLPNTGNLEKDIVFVNTFYSKMLEEAVKKNPEYWFWFHHKWKTQPPAKIYNE
jgi:KDO2-lipid IV(A) lauroyltransferase